MTKQDPIFVVAHRAAELAGLSQEAFFRLVHMRLAPAPAIKGGSGRTWRWRSAAIREWKTPTPIPPAPTREPPPDPVVAAPGVHHLYRHFDAAGQLLYVGVSVHALVRLCDHKKESEWFWRIARIDVTAYATRDDALRAERLAIRREKPRFNVQHARGKA